MKILSWPSSTREYRKACLDMWREMAGEAHAKQIEVRFTEEWKKRKKK